MDDARSLSKSESISVIILIPTVVIFILTIFGIFGNACIVLVTIFAKNLHGVCNWLIGFNALGSLIHQLGHFILIYFVLTGQNTTSLENCFYLQLAPAFFLNFGAFFTLAVGIDRLLVVLFPIKHPFIGVKSYLLFMFLLGCIYSWGLISIAYGVMVRKPEKTVVCVVIGEIFQEYAKSVWICVQMVLVFSIMIVYGTFWAYIKISGKNSIAKKAMRYLTVLTIILVCGWLISTTSRLVAMFVIKDDKILLYVLLYTGMAVNVGCSADYYVYFWLSSEYRAAFKNQFSWLISTWKRPYTAEVRHHELQAWQIAKHEKPQNQKF